MRTQGPTSRRIDSTASDIYPISAWIPSSIIDLSQLTQGFDRFSCPTVVLGP